jgi:hypothetical protein
LLIIVKIQEDIMIKKLFCIRYTLTIVLLPFILLLGGPVIEFDHDMFDSVLKKYVSAGLVDYQGLRSDRKDLDEYLNKMSSIIENDFKKMTESHRLAYLINLYNAETLRLIIDNYPVKGIKSIGGIFKSPWSLPVVSLFGKKISLDDLEHRIIRVEFDEPRIHAALVCAAIGCPELRNEAYRGGDLDSQLESQMKGFMGDLNKNSLDMSKKTANLSPIYKWYSEDFEKKTSLLDYLRNYWPFDVSEVNFKGWRIKHTKYDWSLNEK